MPQHPLQLIPKNRCQVKRSVIHLVVVVALAVSAVAVAQNRNAKADPEFTAFWTKFKGAIAKNDKQLVADMAKLPFMLDSVDRDRAGFIKEYPKLFTPRMRRCITQANPQKDQDVYLVFCGEQIFVFGKVDGAWKFTEIGVND